MRAQTQSVPQPDRAYQVHHSRRLRAIWKIFWMLLGIGCAMVLLFLDVKYTADGLMPVFGNTETSLYLCWALSIIMSPLELAGTQIEAERYLKIELTKDLRVIIQVVVAIVFAADMLTNVMGMVDAAVSAGVVLGTAYYVLIGIVGVGLAFIEYLIDAFVVILSKELANYRDSNNWLRQWEERQDPGDYGHSPRGAAASPLYATGRGAGERSQRMGGPPPRRRPDHSAGRTRPRRN